MKAPSVYGLSQTPIELKRRLPPTGVGEAYQSPQQYAAPSVVRPQVAPEASSDANTRRPATSPGTGCGTLYLYPCPRWPPAVRPPHYLSLVLFMPQVVSNPAVNATTDWVPRARA